MFEPIKVLMVVPNLRVSNGVASYAMNYYRELNHQDIRMDFAVYKAFGSPYIKEIEENGDQVFVLPPVKRLFAHMRACKKIIQAKNYDIIHDNSLLASYPLMRVAKKHIKVRILHSHSARLGETKRNEQRNKFFMPLLLATVNQYAACSSKAGRALFKDREFVIIPNLVDAEKYRFNLETRMTVRQREGCGNNKVIATVGRLTDAKNPFFALEVIDAVLDKRKDAEFWWIGSGALDREVRNAVMEKKNKDRIRLFGSRTDMADLYQAMDLFFLPSKEEGFGLACIEAQASGLPCVVSYSLPEEVAVADNVIFESLNAPVSRWASLILHSLNTVTDRKDGYEKLMRSKYSSKVSASKLEDVYRQMLR